MNRKANYIAKLTQCTRCIYRFVANEWICSGFLFICSSTAEQLRRRTNAGLTAASALRAMIIHNNSTPSLAHCRERTQYEIKPNGIIITYYYPPLLSHRHRRTCRLSIGFSENKKLRLLIGPDCLVFVVASTHAHR